MFLIFCFSSFEWIYSTRNRAKGPVLAPLDPNHARQEQDFSAYCLRYFEAGCAILNEPDSWPELPIDLCIANWWKISSSRAHVGNNINLLVELEIDWFWCCDAWQANSRVFHNLHDLGFVTSPWYPLVYGWSSFRLVLTYNIWLVVWNIFYFPIYWE